MANWCHTTYKIYGPKEQRDKLVTALTELSSSEKPRVDNGLGNLWLGCLVDYFGGDWKKIYCRGDITDWNETDEYIQAETLTAIGEMGGVREFLEEQLPGLTIYYLSDEPGMQEYYTNDETGDIFHVKYVLDAILFSSDIDLESKYFETIEEAANYLNNHGLKCEPTEESICAAVKKFSDEHEDDSISFNKFRIISKSTPPKDLSRKASDPDEDEDIAAFLNKLSTE